MLIQEQMKKGGSSSNLWALRQLADFMASHGSPAALPVSPSSMCQTPINGSTLASCTRTLLSLSHPSSTSLFFSIFSQHADMMMVTPINDLHGWEPGSMVKGERLMRCKLASTHRLFDLYGWAQISRACLTVSVTFVEINTYSSSQSFKKICCCRTAQCFWHCIFLLTSLPPRQLRVSKEQEHFLVLPDGMAYSEVTGSSLVSWTSVIHILQQFNANFLHFFIH